jgi:hypothetical protein
LKVSLVAYSGEENNMNMQRVTGEAVKAAMIEKGIINVPHHDCGGCGVWVRYFREGEQLFFDPRCGCTSRGYPEPKAWESAADWINMQDRPQSRIRIAGLFGIILDAPEATL